MLNAGRKVALKKIENNSSATLYSKPPKHLLETEQ